MTQVEAYIGIGSNIDGPAERVRRAADALGRLPQTQLKALSAFYLNPPMGPAEQPHYVNAAARVSTGLEARHLLDLLHEIEAAHGRLRQQHWGPRTLDLDLLVHGDTLSDDPELMLPHPGIAERAFVLIPLRDIAPDLRIPGLGRVVDLAAMLPEAAVGGLMELAL